MSQSSDIRAALAAGLETALGGLIPSAVATPVDPAEQAQPTHGCAWIAKSVRSMAVRTLGGLPVQMEQAITYTVDFQCYREDAKAQVAALAAQARVDEMVDAFTDWLAWNYDLGGTCLKAIPVGTGSDEDDLLPRASGWSARELLRVEVEFHPEPAPPTP